MWSNRKNANRVHYFVSHASLIQKFYSLNLARLSLRLTIPPSVYFLVDIWHLYLFEVSAYERHIEVAILSMVHCDLTNLIWS